MQWTFLIIAVVCM